MATATETDEDRRTIAEANARQDVDKGRSIDDIAEDPIVEEDDGQLAIAGTKSSLTSTIGGRKPDIAKAKIRSISVPVTGQFERGDRIRVTMDLVCTNAGIKDEEDSNGKVIRAVREHTFRPEEIIAVVVPD